MVGGTDSKEPCCHSQPPTSCRTAIATLSYIFQTVGTRNNLFLPNPGYFSKEWLVVAEQRASPLGGVRLVKVQIKTSVDGKEAVVVEEPSLIVNKSEDRLVAGHDKDVIAVVEMTKERQVVVRYGVGTPDSDMEKVVPLPESPFCLHVVGKAVYLGFSSSVGWVDFSREDPKYIQLMKREHPYGKSYDMFARSGDLLIAVDDIMLPFYGDSFRLGASGPIHEKSFELPSLVNGSYKLAEMVNQDHLLLASASARLAGREQTLHRLSIAKKGNPRNMFGAEMRLGEFQTHSGAIQRTLTDVPSCTSNIGLSQWVDLAVQGGTNILIAAEERGLLLLPVQFKESTQAKILLRGNCTAVRVLLDGSVWAMVSFDEFHGLVKVDPNTGAVLKQVSLDKGFGKLL